MWGYWISKGGDESGDVEWRSINQFVWSQVTSPITVMRAAYATAAITHLESYSSNP